MSRYSGSETAGAERAREWLTAQAYDAAKRERVLHIIRNVSFHTELGGGAGSPPPAGFLPLELHLVRDSHQHLATLCAACRAVLCVCRRAECCAACSCSQNTSWHLQRCRMPTGWM
jgi:hypothetical protein